MADAPSTNTRGRSSRPLLAVPPAAIVLPVAARSRPRQLHAVRHSDSGAATVQTQQRCHSDSVEEDNEDGNTDNERVCTPTATAQLRTVRQALLTPIVLPAASRCSTASAKSSSHTPAAAAAASTPAGVLSTRNPVPADSNQQLATTAGDWSAPLILPRSPVVHTVHKRGLFFLRSHFHTLLAYDDSEPADERYVLSGYPALQDGPFPSVFNITIALDGNVASVYIVDALLQHRLQASGGRLMAWKDGQRREKTKERKTTTAASRAASERGKKKRVGKSDEEASSEESGSDGSDNDQRQSEEKQSAAASPSPSRRVLDPCELSAGLVFHSLSGEPGSTNRSMIFFLFDPLTGRFLSAKKDQRVTVRVINKSRNEQWRLLPIVELGFATLSDAVAARSKWTEVRTRRAEEQREAQLSRAYCEQWPERVIVGSDSLEEWRQSLRCLSRDSYTLCTGDDAKKLLTLHFDHGPSQQHDRQQQQTAVHRFSASGLKRRMQLATVQWRAAKPLNQRERVARAQGDEQNKDGDRGGSRVGRWEPSIDLRVANRTLQHTWRQDSRLHLDRRSEAQDEVVQQNSQHRPTAVTLLTQPQLTTATPPTPTHHAAASTTSTTTLTTTTTTPPPAAWAPHARLHRTAAIQSATTQSHRPAAIGVTGRKRLKKLRGGEGELAMSSGDAHGDGTGGNTTE